MRQGERSAQWNGRYSRMRRRQSKDVRLQQPHRLNSARIPVVYASMLDFNRRFFGYCSKLQVI
jgi:hypothetical protein